MNKQETATLALLDQLAEGPIKASEALPPPCSAQLRGLVMKALVRCGAVQQQGRDGDYLDQGPAYNDTIDRLTELDTPNAELALQTDPKSARVAYLKAHMVWVKAQIAELEVEP
jgi:hypothetical protein